MASGPSRIKAIATDIDGTITDEKRVLCMNAIEALRRCESRGLPVMIASGNILPTAVSLSTLLGFSGPVIAENGGALHYEGHTELFGDREVCLKAVAFLKTQMEVHELFTDQCRLTEVCLEEDVDIRQVRDILADHPVDINQTGFAIHIMSRGTDKSTAISKACEMMKIGTEEVMAIGDSENDIGMLEVCGVGVAVANAPDAVRTRADHVCMQAHGAGVVEALKHFGLI